MKLLGSLISRSFSFGSEQLLKEGLFVSYDAFLIINFFFVLGQSFSSDSGLLILNLLDDEVAHESRGSLLNYFLDLGEHLAKIGKLLVKRIDLLLLDFAADGLEIEGSCVEDIFNIAS